MLAERDVGPDIVRLVSVNVGTPRLLSDRGGERIYSAIVKLPVAVGTTLWLSEGNLAGDAQADLRVHGGADKAIYAYPSEHWEAWAVDLDEAIGACAFGENLSTQGALEAQAGIGDKWRWNDALLQVCQPRWPCFKLSLHRRNSDVQARMRETGRTGWYMRVLEPGEVVVGTDPEVVERDPSGLTVADAHAAMGDRHLNDRELVDAVANHPALAARWREPLRERLARR